MNRIKQIKCPTCQKDTPFSSENRFRPFCSERCKLIDLGAWAAEDHVIKGQEPVFDELMSDEELNEILSKQLH